MKKSHLLFAAALAALCASGATKWRNFDDKSHLFGEKISETDLLGKAVLVYYWDILDERSVEYLPEVEKIWNSFKTKKFRVVGTYYGAKDEAKIKATLEKKKATFPVYYKLDVDPMPTRSKTPYFLVLDHRGNVVYSGGGVKEGTEKIVDSISVIGMPVNLCGDVILKKYKALAGQLKLGKNVANIVKKLEKEAKGKDPNAAAEAAEIVSAVESARDDVKSDIELYCEADPAEAMKLIQLFVKTWPKDDSVAGYKERLPDLKKAAAERAKAEKEKAKAK